MKERFDIFKKLGGFSNFNINEMVSVCNTFIKNIMANFIPHETIIYDDRDPPLQNKFHLAMEESKDTYYSNLSTKLVKQKSNPKTKWFVLKRFLNNKKYTMCPITISSKQTRD